MSKKPPLTIVRPSKSFRKMSQKDAEKAETIELSEKDAMSLKGLFIHKDNLERNLGVAAYDRWLNGGTLVHETLALVTLHSHNANIVQQLKKAADDYGIKDEDLHKWNFIRDRGVFERVSVGESAAEEVQGEGEGPLDAPAGDDGALAGDGAAGDASE